MWTTRAETTHDRAAVHRVLIAAFPTTAEAELVDRLRGDPEAWIPELSVVAADERGQVVALSLMTRCHVGGDPALALAPCAVLPEHQRRGAGTATIRHGLHVAAARGERLVVVLGHPTYYPRFGFSPASALGVTAPMEVPDDSFPRAASRRGRPRPRHRPRRSHRHRQVRRGLRPVTGLSRGGRPPNPAPRR